MHQGVEIALYPSVTLYQPNTNLIGRINGNTPEAYDGRQVEPNRSPNGTMKHVGLRAFVLRSIQ